MGGHEYYENIEVQEGIDHITNSNTYYKFGKNNEYSHNETWFQEVYMCHIFKEGTNICVILQDQRENWESPMKCVDDFHLVGVATGTLDMDTRTVHVHPMHIVDIDNRSCMVEGWWLEDPEVKKLFSGLFIHIDLQINRDDAFVERCLQSSHIGETDDSKDTVMQVLEQYGQMKSATECLVRIEELSQMIQGSADSAKNKRRFNEMHIMMQKAQNILSAQKMHGAKVCM